MKLHNRKNAGFTLIELMIVVAIIAIIASVAIPKLLSAKLAANESAAISTLRSISSGQAQIQSSNAIDCDSDGGGEFGYFAELAGTIALREDDGTQNPAVGADLLQPAILSTALGIVNNSVVTRSGYIFQMYLPDANGVGVIEAAAGGMGAPVSPDLAEVFFCCYAWPLDAGTTGNRVFFINQDGDILQFGNKDATYDGAAAAPTWDAAFAAGAVSMGDPIANGAAGLAGNDGETWTVLQ